MGVVEADYHQFLISAIETDPTATYTRGEVFDAGENLIVVHTGVSVGPVTVTLEVLDSEPELLVEEWDNVSMVRIVAKQPMNLITTIGAVADQFGVIAPSPTVARAFRLSVRGRAGSWDKTVDEPIEEYLVQTWPAPAPTIIREFKQTDGVWVIDEEAPTHSGSTLDMSDGTVAATGKPVYWRG